jgi:5'-methylthioadenosine phosphorylase
VRALLKQLPVERTCGCGSALKDAIITRPDRIPPETRRRLALLVDKYLK